MAGRLVEVNEVEASTSHRKHLFWSRPFEEADELTKEDWKLERFSDTPSPEYSEDPCLFHKNPNRSYFLQYTSHGPELISAYRASLDFSNTADPLENCAVIMISSGKFAAAIFKNYKVYSEVELQSKHYPLPKTDKKFRKDVEKLLLEMKSELKEIMAVYVRCREEDKMMITGGDSGKENSKYRHIPFVTGMPSGNNVIWVYEKLQTIQNHGQPFSFLDRLREERLLKKKKNTFEEVLELGKVESGEIQKEKKEVVSKEIRRSEREKWNWVGPRLTSKIATFIRRNDSDSLSDSFEELQENNEFLDYLNFRHPLFNGNTFLHLAVKNGSCDVTNVLLEFGADPSVKNKEERVPFEFCGCDRLEAIFMDFREQNEGKYNWSKTKIPERIEYSVQKLGSENEFFKEEKRSLRDEKREKRRRKLEKRRVFYEEF